MRPTNLDNLAGLASLEAFRSNCVRSKVGAAAVTTNKRVLTGYNTTPDGSPCECLDPNTKEVVSKDSVIHAEIMLIDQLEPDEKINTILITHSPCINCAKRLLPLVDRVYYIHEYRLRDGIEYLKENGVECTLM